MAPMVTDHFDVRSFQAVDASGFVEELAGHLRASAALDAVANAREDLRAALGVAPGARILDVGCGLGEEVVALARLVAPGGLAVGMDASVEFLTAAAGRSRRAGATAEFVLGDAHDLPFPDAGFDGVRIERTLQHLADPDRVLAEAARVLVPGGVIAVAEPDWGSAVIRGGDPAVCAAVAQALGDGVRHRRIGLELPQRLERAGLAVKLVRPGIVELTDAARAIELLRLPDAVGAAVADGLSAAVGRAWLDELGVGRGFRLRVTGYLAAARKPG
jgi:SAM-dependent methyltransferase